MGVDRISLIASTLLKHASDALSAQGRELPDRRYVSHSEPAWDCEQLTVHLVNLLPQLVGRGDPNVQGRTIVRARAQFAISLVACAPTSDDMGDPPSPTALNDNALARLEDGWAIWSWLTRLWVDNLLLPPSWVQVHLRTDPPVNFDSLTLAGPSGKYAGVKMLLTITIPALAEAAGAS